MNQHGGSLSRSLAVVTAIAIACGCGGGGDDDDDAASSHDEKDYVDAVAYVMAQDRLSDEQNECLAQSFVEAVGLDEMSERTPDEIRESSHVAQLDLDVDQPEHDAFGEGMRACIDVRAVFLDSAADEGPGVVECLDQNLDQGLVETFSVTIYIDGESGVSDDPELVSGFNALFNACGRPS